MEVAWSLATNISCYPKSPELILENKTSEQPDCSIGNMGGGNIRESYICLEVGRRVIFNLFGNHFEYAWLFCIVHKFDPK
jgi:hypothetical protein